MHHMACHHRGHRRAKHAGPQHASNGVPSLGTFEGRQAAARSHAALPKPAGHAQAARLEQRAGRHGVLGVAGLGAVLVAAARARRLARADHHELLGRAQAVRLRLLLRDVGLRVLPRPMRACGDQRTTCVCRCTPGAPQAGAADVLVIGGVLSRVGSVHRQRPPCTLPPA